MSDDLSEIHRSLGIIEGKLDALQDQLNRHMKKHDKVDRDVAYLQADVNKAKGATTMIGAVAGLLGALIVLIIKAFWEDG